MLVNNELVGNVFGTCGTHANGCPVLWVTQLCVQRDYRNRGIAKQLLECLTQDGTFKFVGILSSHPFAIMAILSVSGRDGGAFSETTKNDAEAVMKSSPVGYVRDAKIGGSGKCADTRFWVDHQEPLHALETLKDKGVVWPFGELPEGHEFLVLVERKDDS
jgi:hypothetical protein